MNKRTMAALLGSALLSSHAVANTDSVNDWGKWGQLFTAAGQPTVNIPLNFNFNTGPNPIDSKKFVAEVQENRIYGIIRNWDSRNNYYYYYGNDNERISSYEYTADAQSLSFTFTGDEGSSISGTEVPLYNYYNYTYYYDDGNGNRHGTYQQNRNHSSPDQPYIYSYFYANGTSSYDYSYTELYEYFSDGQSGTYSIGSHAYVLDGPTTDINKLQQLAGISSATYRGHLWWGGSVALEVNFKNASWNGTFDTDNHYNNSQAGILTVKNGTISGANLDASLANISSDSTTLKKGVIEGSFFGENAQIIAGIVDVTSQDNDRYTNLFTAHESKKNISH